MGSLRLILLVLGIAVIAGVFIWDHVQRRREKRFRTVDISRRKLRMPSIHGRPEGEGRDVLPAPPAVTPIPAVERQTDISGFSISTGRAMEHGENTGTTSDLFPHDAAAAERVSGSDDEAEAGNQIRPEKIIILHVVAGKGRTFSGENIVNALEQVEFQFGKMNIFHHYGLGEIKSDLPLFSAVNMVEPGQFDPDTISQLTTPGISLFLCLPAPLDARVVFDFMLNIATDLAELLGGEIQGENHRRLDQTAVVNIKKTLLRSV